MKFLLNKVWILSFIFIAIISGVVYAAETTGEEKSVDYKWTSEELEWIKTHENKTLEIGLDPLTGMDYYIANGIPTGYLISVLKIFENELGVKINVVDQYSWSDTLDMLKTGDIDLIFGANPTHERLQYMAFTASIYDYPYSVYASKNRRIATLGDLDEKKIGFLRGDAVIGKFSDIYKNIHYKEIYFEDQIFGLEALRNGTIDAFITANGGIAKKYIHDYSDIGIIADLDTVSSEMTISGLRKNRIMIQILDKIIASKREQLDVLISDSSKKYNRYILALTPDEVKWLNEHETIIVGAPDDYLPFDYYEEGKYKGIAGNYLTEIANQVGLEMVVVRGPFDVLYEKIQRGEIFILNMAKTKEREERFRFTKPFSEERDAIYGHRDLPYLQDIYELENKKVAIVKGYWHKDYLEKNLSHVVTVETKDLKESLKFVSEKKADYLIENPTVASYYIEGLGYSNIIEKGTTSQDSFLYFGVIKDQSPLVGILNKAMPLVRYDLVKSMALQEVPTQRNIANTRLLYMLAALGVILISALVYLFKTILEMIDHRTKRFLLEEREKLIYVDGLTGLYNRLFFNYKEQEIMNSKLPHIMVMMDLNGLKQVNDNYGHVGGDKLIITFSELLKQNFPQDTIIRMGGDEFLIIQENKAPSETEKMLENLEQACRETRIQLGEGNEIIPSASYGWAIQSENLSVNDAVIEADQMMYQHKASLRRRRFD